MDVASAGSATEIDRPLSLPKRQKEKTHDIASDYQSLNFNAREYYTDPEFELVGTLT